MGEATGKLMSYYEFKNQHEYIVFVMKISFFKNGSHDTSNSTYYVSV